MRSAVFISAVFPFPANAGHKVIVSGILAYLYGRYGTENVTYVLVGKSDDGESLRKEIPCKLCMLKKPGVLEQLWNIFWFVMVRRAKSIQEAMLYSAKLERELQAIITNLNPRLTVCDMLRAGQFFETTERPEGHYILYMEDLLSVRYRKMLEALNRFPQAHLEPLGGFAKLVPSFLRPLTQISSIQKLVLRLEQKLIEKRERDCVRWFDSTLLVNKEETSLLQRATGCASIQTIKPLVQSIDRATGQRHYNGKPIFVFLGGLNVPHNHFSMVHFIRTQMDRITEKIPGVKLRIIGEGKNRELLRLAERYKGAISIEGFVDDLDAVFSESCAMVIPLLFGSGVKLKTLEAFSRGLPVISTTFGVEGISVKNNVDCIVENNIDRYPEIMSRLLDINYNFRISLGALELYSRDYSREQLIQEYNSIFGVISER